MYEHAEAPPLLVGPADDAHERAADAAADALLAGRRPAPPPADTGPGGCGCAAGGSGARCACARRSALPGSARGTTTAPASVHAALRGPGAPLDPGRRAWFERAFGADLSGVRVRTDPGSAAEIGAAAYSVGDDVVLGAAAGPATLAHELAHVLQSRAGAPTRVRRQPPTAEAMRAQAVAEAAAFLDTLRRVLADDRRSAQARVAAATPGSVTVRVVEVLATFNQQSVRRSLAKARSTYAANRVVVGADDPAQARLRTAMTAFAEEARVAAEAVWTIAQQNPAVVDEQRSQLGQTLIEVVAASPFQSAALGTRTAFTPAEATASTTAESTLQQVLTRLPYVNLARPTEVSAAIAALAGAGQRVTTGAAGAAPTRVDLAAPLRAQLDAALVELRAAQATFTRAGTLLDSAAGQLEAWLLASTVPTTASQELERWFRTQDLGYGRLLADRLRLLRREIGGNGTLFAHQHIPGDTRTCEGATCGDPEAGVKGEVPRPYEFAFCCPFTNVDRDARILLHEVAHAVIPDLGVRGRQTGLRPVDRAYAGERLLLTMTTEEALSNAETYVQFVYATAASNVANKAIPTDTYTGGFSPDEQTALAGALARAQARIRRAYSWTKGWRAAFQRDGAYGETARRVTTAGFGRALTDAEIDTAFRDMATMAGSGAWEKGQTFTRVAKCPAGVLGRVESYVVTESAVTKKAGGKGGTMEVCPAFFAAGAETQVRAVAPLVMLRLENAGGGMGWARPQDMLAYLATGQAIWNIDIHDVSGRTHADHLAADNPAPAPTTPAPAPAPASTP